MANEQPRAALCEDTLHHHCVLNPSCAYGHCVNKPRNGERLREMPTSAASDAAALERKDRAPASDAATGGGRKMDEGKAPILQGFLRYFPRAVIGVAWVSEYGDRKYVLPGGDHYTDNWCRVPNGLDRYGDADARHTLKRHIEGEYDERDSGLAHLQQKAWNAMAELERALRDGDIECRRGNDIVAGKPVLGTARKVEF